MSLKEFYVNNFGSSCTSFKGRLTRRQFVIANLLLAITIAPLALISIVLLVTKTFILGIVALVVTIIVGTLMSLSIHVRRLHDLDYSGVTILLTLIPIVNIFLWIALVYMRGTVGVNKYGEDSLPVEIGEEYTLNNNDSLIKGLPKSIIKNMYGSVFRNKLLSTSGRANRYEYFVKTGGAFLLYQLIVLVAALSQFGKTPSSDVGIVLLPAVIIGLLADVRRGHDCGRPWYYSILFIVPFVNFVYIAKQFATPGQTTANQYGECTVPLDQDGQPMDDF